MQLRLFLLFVLFSVAICNPAKKEGKVDEKESSEAKSNESNESSDTKSSEEELEASFPESMMFERPP